MKTILKFRGGAAFDVETGSGHQMTIDGAEEIGGQNLAARPMELVLAGLGGCTAMDVLMILRKGRHDVEDIHIELEAERAASAPKVFTHIVVNYVVTGRGLNTKTVQRAVDLSAEKYCSASIMIAKTATIEHKVRVMDLDADSTAA